MADDVHVIEEPESEEILRHARAILDAAREGQPVTRHEITAALRITGDIE